MKRFVVMAAVFAAACSMVSRHEDTLRSRASFDMHCSTERLQVTEIDDHTAGVDGCGRSGTYIWEPGAGTWVLNSPARR